VDKAARAELHQHLRKLADRDRSAFPPVFNALWPVLRTFVARQLPPPDSEDVVQEALLKVFARASEFDPDRDALTWALAITVFEIRTARNRVARRKEELGEPASTMVDPASPEQLVVRRDLEAAALEALGTLRPSDVETLDLVLSGKSPPVSRVTPSLASAKAVCWIGGSSFSLCALLCPVSGLIAGLSLGVLATRHDEDRFPFVTAATLVAGLTGTIGCALAGVLGVAGMVAGGLLGLAPSI
jgi:RNA polymerase sigma-70 factor (ECF subfamily)